MKRNYIPGTTTRFFGIVLLLICTVGLSHYSQIFQRHADTHRLRLEHTRYHLQHIHSLYESLKHDRSQLLDTQAKASIFVDYSNPNSVQAMNSMREHYVLNYKHSLITLACVLEGKKNNLGFECDDFSLAVRRLDHDARLRQIDYKYTEIYRMQTSQHTEELNGWIWATMRNEQMRHKIFHGFLFLQIWGIWMITYGEMLSRSKNVSL